MSIRRATPHDAQAIVAIYNHYILHSTATFELEPLTIAQMRARIEKVAVRYAWFVFEQEGEVAGYAYADAFHGRAGFRHTVEPSIYVADGWAGQGIGKALYAHLLDYLEHETDCHAVIAVLAVPNPGSEALHAALGFRQAGRITQVGRKFERWLDIAYWEKHFAWPRPRLR
ncbi:hypothetical protein AAV94_00970 [Lampropedia cohaerens]|uniref:N-acetyltransferase domain-containing protein n=1 Tax=Lampropedia cohaerens TaxID=1610491 RepID=A0A0U1Q2Q1_9BURK|nr:GNAT family N-acetyltransferase [Lampropedia cohaerens]KKW69021.1 hypothetical protein AAV94_00970 [Lampropedia cohaerens]